MRKKHGDYGIPANILPFICGRKMLQMILCILSTACENETHARLILSVRISGRLSVSLSVSQWSVYHFSRTCQFQELCTTFCNILHVPFASGDSFSLVLFNILQ